MSTQTSVKLERFKSFPVAPGLKQPWEGFGWRLTGRNKTVDEWRELYPDCNIGIETGLFNGIFVIDVDIADMDLPQLNHTFTVETPRGGRHYYYHLHEDMQDVSSCTNLYGSIDLRVNGGYVVAPPSCVGEGGYRVVVDAPIAMPSEETLAWVQNSPKLKRDQKYLRDSDGQAQKAYARKTEFYLLNRIRSSEEGSRNRTLIESSYAFGQLSDVIDRSKSEIFELVSEAYEQVDPDTPQDTVYRQINHAYTKGLEKPRGPVTRWQIAYMANAAKQLLQNKRTRLTDELVLDYFGYRVLESGITSPLLPVRDVALATGKSHMTISRCIERLVECQILERNGTRKEFTDAQSYRLGQAVFANVLHNPHEDLNTYRDYVTEWQKLYPFYGRPTDVSDAWTHYELGESARYIFKCLVEADEPLSPKEIVELTSLAQRTVYRKLKQLLEAEIIAKIDKKYYLTGLRPEATGRGYKRSVKMESRYRMERKQYNKMIEANKEDEGDD